MGLSSFVSDGNVLHLRLMKVEQTEEHGRPIVHLFGRDSSGERHHIEVEGHPPSFFVLAEDISSRTENNPAIDHIEFGYEGINGEELARVYTYKPSNVSDIRDAFSKTWEADVLFEKRFLIDNDIYTGVSIDTSNSRQGYDGDIRVGVDDISPCDPPDVDPRIVALDIEVAAPSFPHPEEAAYPLTSIVAYDSYTEETVGWLLQSDEWDVLTELEVGRADTEPDRVDMDDFRLFDDERQLITDFSRWLSSQEPDLITGWNSNDFDLHYLINRCRNLDMWVHGEWSPLGDVWHSNWGPTIKGVTCFDMLQAYKKTQIHKLNSYKLEDVATKELGEGKRKMPHDFETMWHEHPCELMRYNVRDVEAVVEIDESAGVVELFEHLRDVAGVEFDDCHTNIDIIDVLMLRRGKDAGIRLPTATKPDEDWYHGAFVFEPRAGLHEHMLYPDLSSLYPNLMRQCNMSSETIVGTRAELMMSKHNEDDCLWSWVDPRPVKRVEADESYNEYKDGEFKAIMRRDAKGNWQTVWHDDPEFVKLYYLKKGVNQGFISGVVDELLGMKNQYRGTDKYEAVKRICNSVYGVTGDSNSYGTGFRLFDWRIAESITLGGRKTIQFSADEFVDYVNEYKVVSGHDGDDAYIVAGDTDSAVTSIPFVTDAEEAIEIGEWSAQQVNDKSYDTFCLETFGTDEHHMFLDVESYSTRCFFVQDPKKEDGVGVKKRYVSLVTYEDGEELDEPKLNVKGFEYVRSDQAQVTVDTQQYIFEQLMNEDEETAHENVKEYLTDLYQAARDGDIDLDRIGIPFGIGQPLDEYGDENRSPMPQHRGARYANKHIYGSDVISEGDKPKYYYVTDTGGHPTHYSSDVGDDGREVDAISVLDADDIPEDIEIDMETMMEKTVQNKVMPIYETMGWDWEKDLLGMRSLADFM